jgi:hypothetical protein
MSTSFTFMSHLLNKEKVCFGHFYNSFQAEILAPVNLSVPESSNREILLEWIFEVFFMAS